MISYEFSQRLFRLASHKNAKPEISVKDMPLSIPFKLRLPPESKVVGSLAYFNNSFDILVRDETNNFFQLYHFFVNQLKTSGWIQIFKEDDDENEQLSSFIKSSYNNKEIIFMNCISNFFLLISPSNSHGKNDLYHISIETDLRTARAKYGVPKRQIQNLTDPLPIIKLSNISANSTKILHRSSTEAEYRELSVVNTALSSSNLFKECTTQISSAGWTLAYQSGSSSAYLSSWLVKRADIPRYQLILTIKKINDGKDYFVSLLIERMGENYYPHLLIQSRQAIRMSERLSTEFIETMLMAMPAPTAISQLTFSSEQPTLLSIPLPIDAEVVGSAIPQEDRIWIFVNFRLSAPQVHRYFQDHLETIGWKSYPLPLKKTGRGIIDSGFEYKFPKIFLSPQEHNQQILVRTFSTSVEATDVEIVIEPQEVMTLPANYSNQLTKQFDEHSFLPSLQPHINSLTETISERLDTGLYISTGYIHTSSDLTEIEEHYVNQLLQERWLNLTRDSDDQAFLSSWEKDVGDNESWYCLLSLVGVAERINDYSVQLTCIRLQK